MTQLVDLVILAFACTRLTLLITTDEITSPLRERIWRRFEPGKSRFGYLFTCNWCTSVYTASLLVIMYRIFETQTIFVSTIFALSLVASIIANRAT
jgi:hypothetical protein